METLHHLITEDASAMDAIEDQSIDLVVTSPPYPMIEMWDELFCVCDPEVATAMCEPDPESAFEGMHRILDNVWKETRRVLRPGGLICINIGDATRSFDGHFRLFANHARIVSAFRSLGFTQLPAILWRKPTNAPNKFMGSGMLPPNAYVTLEHEYVLIFRSGTLRDFSQPDRKAMRRRSAFFWEERNSWFSDVWIDLPGATQDVSKMEGRQRSGAFPFELPYRLINMFSVKGDTVLDPFLGTGTTMLAAMCSARHSIGYEIEPALKTAVLQRLVSMPETAHRTIRQRIENHLAFVDERSRTKGALTHRNRHYDFPVVTRQEEDLCFDWVKHIQFLGGDRFRVTYSDTVARVSDQSEPPCPPMTSAPKGRQLKLF